MNELLFTFALVAYLLATGLALTHLIQRGEGVYRMASLTTQAGWVLHTLALVVRGVELARPPLATLPEAVSVVVWAAVLLTLWAERQFGVKVLGAFVLPVVFAFGVSAAAIPGGVIRELAPTLRSAWISVHVVLALLGISAFVLNFAGGIMYLLQERQLKSKRPGTFYYRLPSLETLDRMTYRALTLGFPFLTLGLILGVIWAGSAWGSVFTFDPLAVFSVLTWFIYAATLSGRAVAGWRGRRAAYFAVAGFAALVLTLGAGLFLPGRHGS
ncbi:MAG: cytochrome c biogenesis protein CcsA [Candidatus Methylomirabilia bacterium]